MSLDIDFELKYKNKTIGNQRNKIKVYEDDLFDIYNSRTFCLFEDIEIIKKWFCKRWKFTECDSCKRCEILNPEG